VQKAEKAEAKNQIARMISLAQKAYGEVHRDTAMDPLETAVMLLLADGTTPERAARARRAIEEEYVDLNEVRVSPPSQIAEVIAGVGDEDKKAFRIKRFLERLFNHQHCVDFSFFADLSPQGARAYLEEVEGMPGRVVDNMMMRFFNEGVLPVDAGIVRVAQRVGLVGRVRPKDAEALLRELVLKRQVLPFHELISRVANDACLASVKHCERCPLAPVCKTAKALAAKKKQAAASRKPKRGAKATTAKKPKKTAAKKAAKKTSAKVIKSAGAKRAKTARAAKKTAPKKSAAKSSKGKRAAKSR